MTKSAQIKALKKAAAAEAVSYVRSGTRLGIGTGSTAEEFIILLAEKLRQGLNIIGVATSERSRSFCLKSGVPLADFNTMPELDLTIDGADELDSRLRLIKGGGGALLHEKITAYASKKMIIIADESKLVRRLGAFPLPIEVNSFGLAATEKAVIAASEALGLKPVIKLRRLQAGGEQDNTAISDKANMPFTTDGGHYILDAYFHEIPAAESLAKALYSIPGVVEHGLFFHKNCMAIIAQNSGAIKIIEKTA